MKLRLFVVTWVGHQPHIPDMSACWTTICVYSETFTVAHTFDGSLSRAQACLLLHRRLDHERRWPQKFLTALHDLGAKGDTP